MRRERGRRCLEANAIASPKISNPMPLRNAPSSLRLTPAHVTRMPSDARRSVRPEIHETASTLDGCHAHARVATRAPHGAHDHLRNVA